RSRTSRPLRRAFSGIDRRRYPTTRIRDLGWRIHSVVRAMKRVTGSGIVGGQRRRPEGTALRRYKLLLLLPILALLLPACGTRLPNSAFVNAGNKSGSGVAAGDEGGTDQSGNGGTAGDAGTAGGATAGGTAGGAAGAAAGKTGGAAGAAGGGASGPNT